MIVLVCGYKMWFDNAQKLVKYGNWNVDRSASALAAVEVRPIASDINYAIDRVIVIGKTEDISGTATVGSPGTPPKTLMYQYTECADSAEAQSIANQILADRSILMERFECDILPGNYIYNEGDRVKISDARSNTYGTYGVKDISITTEKTTLGLGCSEITIFDLLGDKLTEISGSSFNGVDDNWTGGKQNIGTTAPATYFINITDKAAIDSFILSLKFNKWSKDIALAGATSNFEVGEGGFEDEGSDSKLSDLDSTGWEAAGGYNGPNNAVTVPVDIGTMHSINVPLSTVPVNFSTDVNDTIKILSHITPYHFSILNIWFNLSTINNDDNIKYRTVYISIHAGDWIDFVPSETNLIHSTFTRVYFSRDVYDNNSPYKQSNHISISIPLQGFQSTDNHKHIKIMVSRNAPAGLMNIDYGEATLTVIESHDHSFVPIDHKNPIYGAEHYHYTPTLHGNHSVTDSDHAHHETNNKSTVGSGPSNMSISIKNSAYPSGYTIASSVSGSTTWKQNISSFLSNGDNIISISSATIGSVDASASFINYGK
ncbi:MAG: hypothetical protein WCY33_06610 [Clostridia bacterium]